MITGATEEHRVALLNIIKKHDSKNVPKIVENLNEFVEGKLDSYASLKGDLERIINETLTNPKFKISVENLPLQKVPEITSAKPSPFGAFDNKIFNFSLNGGAYGQSEPNGMLKMMDDIQKEIERLSKDPDDYPELLLYLTAKGIGLLTCLLYTS